MPARAALAAAGASWGLLALALLSAEPGALGGARLAPLVMLLWLVPCGWPPASAPGSAHSEHVRRLACLSLALPALALALRLDLAAGHEPRALLVAVGAGACAGLALAWAASSARGTRARTTARVAWMLLVLAPLLAGVRSFAAPRERGPRPAWERAALATPLGCAWSSAQRDSEWTPRGWLAAVGLALGVLAVVGAQSRSSPGSRQAERLTP